MEKKLYYLKQQVESLVKRIQKAIDNNTVSSIEIDIIMEQLRNTYIIAEEIKELTIITTKNKSLYTAPLAEFPDNPVVEKHPEILVTVPSMPKQQSEEKVLTDLPVHESDDPFNLPGEKVRHDYVEDIPKVHQPVFVQQEMSGEPDKISYHQAEVQREVDEVHSTTNIEEVISKNTPSMDSPFISTPVSIEEIPIMKFPEIEVQSPSVQTPPVQASPEQTQPVESSKVETPPVYTHPAQSAHVQSPPVESSTVQSTPVYSNPIPATPVQPAAQSGYYTAPDKVAAMHEVSQPERSSGKSSDLFGSQTLGDKYKKETPSLNEKIIQGREDQTLAHRMQLKPISDLKTAIGINEKFQLVNDLFLGRIDLYNDAINRLNTCGSSYSADVILEALKNSHNWKEETEAFGRLRTFITRRYLS